MQMHKHPRETVYQATRILFVGCRLTCLVVWAMYWKRMGTTDMKYVHFHFWVNYPFKISLISITDLFLVISATAP